MTYSYDRDQSQLSKVTRMSNEGHHRSYSDYCVWSSICNLSRSDLEKKQTVKTFARGGKTAALVLSEEFNDVIANLSSYKLLAGSRKEQVSVYLLFSIIARHIKYKASMKYCM